MTLKHQRLIAHFLSTLEKQQRISNANSVNPVFLKLLSREDLLEIIDWRFQDKALRDINLDKMNKEELLFLIGDNLSILAHTLFKWNKRINAMVTFSQEEVAEFFEQTQNALHYLRTKPVEEWDEYDRNNYLSLLSKAGVTQRVFAIYSSDIREEDKYAAGTQRSSFFDTREEAEQELERCYEHGLHKWESMQILSLWKIKP